MQITHNNTQYFGEFTDSTHYLESITLVNNSSNETKDRIEFLQKKIPIILNSYDNFLDIGIGDGRITKLVGYNFENITLIENSISYLDNVPDYHWCNGKKIQKICGSIINTKIQKSKYDLILMSHVLYYFNNEERKYIISKLYDSLKEDGTILLIYNDGMDRDKLFEKFGKYDNNFKNFTDYLKHKYKVSLDEIQEKIESDSVCNIMNIIGVFLNDMNTKVLKEDLLKYVNQNHLINNKYMFNMIQNFILIRK